MKKLLFLTYFLLVFTFTKAQQPCQVGIYTSVYCSSAAFYPYAFNPADTLNYYQLPLVSVQWNFGDSDSLFTFTNPDDGSLHYATHTYNAEGNYNVCCTIITADGCIDTQCELITIDGVCNLQPVIYANADYYNPTTYYFSSYVNQCTTEPLSYSWNFGDGTAPVTDLYPTHTYAADGVYQVCATIAYTDGSCEQTACMYVLVDTNGPENCTLDLASYAYGNTNQFYFDAFISCDFLNIDTIATPYYNWYYNWDFGNGQTSADYFPIVSYNSIGTYTVCVTAINDFGTVLSDCITIEVTQLPTDCAVALAAQSDIPDGFTYTFTPSLNPECMADTLATIWWDFGDGTALSLNNTSAPQHTYSYAGYYYVCLYITTPNSTNNYACQYVIVGDADCMPTFSLSQGATLSSFIFTPALNNCSDPTGLWTYTWDFGDGTTLTGNTQNQQEHTYNTDGYYSVCMTATSPNGTVVAPYCSSVYVYTGTANCDVSFYAYTYNGFTFDFSIGFENGLCGWFPFDTYNYTWDFGDGNTLTTTNTYVQHTYTQFAPTNVCVTAVNTAFADTSVYCASISPAACYIPLYLSAYPTSSPGTYQFDAGFYLPLTEATFAWDFGDGTTAAEPMPTHAFTENGTYNVCCTVATDTCTNTVCTTVLADIDGPSSCEIIFYPADFGDGTFAFYPYISATNPEDWIYTYYPEQWTYLWDFGNGQTSTEPYPYVFFDSIGVYNVCVTASYGTASTITYCQNVTVTNSQYSCSAYYYAYTYDGSTYTFYPSIGGTCAYTNPNGWANFGENWTYFWDFGNGQTSSEITPTIALEPNVFYNVCLTATNTEQDFTDTFCSPVVTYSYLPGTDTSAICNLTYYAITYDATTFLLYPFFSSACTNTDMWTYLWDFGNGQTSTDTYPIVTFDDFLNYEVCLTATSLTGQVYNYCNTLIAGGGVIGGQIVGTSGGLNEGRIAGQAMEGITVLLLNQYHQLVATTTTDANGNYQFNSLPPGTYYVTVQMSGMLAQEANVTLQNQSMMNLNVDFMVTASAVVLSQNTTTTIEQQAQHLSVTLYPNPTNNDAVVNLQTHTLQTLQITLFNFMGQKVYETQVQTSAGNEPLTLPLNNLPGGVYIVQITDNGKILYHQKVVKQ
ncbi:MAG TPA: PKD domain-containing protein [Chitinophagales bacterium]|mgnify:CR=1 FL=1|nr:PKD domain-containing protein [Chitinophagales bacterium]HRK28178.1 PKD domain-containing protein [Chitinophagales bacterium]